ncbi:SusE domain-containing protein [Chryseobacterium sp. RG1]|uniref:SusE domain-containing protein n=1 Tax=Chryseobacterium tagetis TaxID=2801334 RepID=A0ABS7ZZA1_9FLAO|nr:SusE domain-containing protein [Chryseobacterium tagetis]MCA6065791.1 SusE domain-containing protein [Chryseobacterium tagetis]
MKHLFKIFTIALIGFLVISCEKDEDQAVLGEGTDPVISANKTTAVLLSTDAANEALAFSWINSDYGVNVQLTNQLEFALKGTSFSTVKTIDMTSGAKSYGITVNDLNNIVLSLGVSSVVATDIEIRLKSTVANKTHYSNILPLKVTPFINGPVYTYTDLYLIGDATAGAWDNLATNAKIYPLLKTSTANVYTYTGYFAVGGFKIIKTPGSWTTQYGMGSSAGVLDTSGGSGNISITTAGYYKVTINLGALTYSVSSITPSSTTYTAISLIGPSVGGWSTDLDLEKSTFDPHVWVKKNVMLSSGEFKFRANHDWGTSWGIAQEFFGTATGSGGNIPVTTTFNYNVYFNDMTGDFSVIPVN